MKNNLLACGVAFAVFAPLLASAQAAKAERPKAAAQLTYRSAFTDYKPYVNAPLANWRELNDAVAGAPDGAGGMAGTKGMELPRTPAAPASGAMQKTAPVHDGHHMKGGKP